MTITLATKPSSFLKNGLQTQGECVLIAVTPQNSHAVGKGALGENPFLRIWLVILPVLRLVLAPALELPVFRHDIEMATPSYLASLNSPLIKERSETVSHRASKTKAGEQLTVWLGIQPDFVDEFVFH